MREPRPPPRSPLAQTRGAVAAAPDEPAAEVVALEQCAIFGRHAARACDIVDAGRHHRNADDAFEAFVEGRADDDVGLLVDLLADAGGGLVNLVERKILAA